MSRAARRAGPGALLLIAGCFAASGVLRIVEGGGAIAREIATQVAAAPHEAAPPALDRPLPTCKPDPGTDALLAAIRDREAQLAAQADALAAREKLMTVAQAKIEEQIAALSDAERRLSETLAIADKAAESDIARLVTVYETMAPKAAAQIFGTMDVDFAAGFLVRMKPENAAQIMALLQADRAYAISATMAGRNARAPTE